MNKEKFWKILAIVSCSLLVIVALCSFSVKATSQYYDLCKCLEDIEAELSNIQSAVYSVESALLKIGGKM